MGDRPTGTVTFLFTDIEGSLARHDAILRAAIDAQNGFVFPTGGDRGAGVDLVDLGSHQLKGLVEPIQVFGVRAPDLIWIDQPLATVGPGRRGNAIAGEHRDEHLHYRAAHLAIRLSTIYPELAEGAVARLNAAAQRQGTVHLLVERLPDRVTAAEAYRRAPSMAIAAGSVHAEVYATSSLAMALLLGDTPPDAECRQLLRRACDSRLPGPRRASTTMPNSTKVAADITRRPAIASASTRSAAPGSDNSTARAPTCRPRASSRRHTSFVITDDLVGRPLIEDRQQPDVAGETGQTIDDGVLPAGLARQALAKRHRDRLRHALPRDGGEFSRQSVRLVALDPRRLLQ